MIRKFNYTGRKKIPVDRVDIKLEKYRGKPYFLADLLSLESLNINPVAKLIIEAFDRGSYQRFNWGTVEQPVSPKPEDLKLSEIQEAESVNFRIRAVDSSEAIGKILATTKDIRVWAEEVAEVRKSSLLPVLLGNIGDSIWEINFNVPDEKNPELIINDKFDNVKIKEMLRTDAFFTTLAYPSVLNTILSQIILVDDIRTTDEFGWRGNWLKFTLMLPSVEPIPESGNAIRDMEWINSTVSAFCKEHSMLDILKDKIEG